MSEAETQEAVVVWEPLPGSQMLAISAPCHLILYEGTRGPGKTDTQLMYFRKMVGQGFGKHWRGVIFDREYKNLDDIVSKSERWFPQFGDGAKFLRSTKDYKWVWPTGEELLFRSIQKKKDYDNFHGQEFPFIGWNELTKHPTPELFDLMMSCNRSSYRPSEPGAPEIPLVVFATTNPHGAGHNWVKRRFIDVAEPGQVVRKTINVFNPRTKTREDIVKTQVRIFGSYKENPFLAPEYIATLETTKEPNRRRAWLWGDWDIVSGGALDDVWNSDVHKLPRFKIPSSWYIDRSFDWGSTKPFSVGFWAESDGTEVKLPDGRIFCPPAGSLIRFAELYGCQEDESNVGLKLSAVEVAKRIKAFEAVLMEQKWISKPVRPGPADNSIRNVIEGESDSIETKMSSQGIRWTESDKKPGSRKNGLQLVRDRLEAAVNFSKGEFDTKNPGLYIMENCRHALSILPVIPRDDDNPDDVDTDSEDHIYDDLRYRVLAGSRRLSTTIKVSFPT